MTILHLLATGWHRFVVVATGEWMLHSPSRRANGGSIVLARSFWCAALVYAATIGLKEALDPATLPAFSFPAFRQVLSATLPWFGAIFAATYASLYTRFSGQWMYLAGVYNQIKAAELRMHEKDPSQGAREALANWKAGFIEDADDLHLATKPLFASVIKAWLEDRLVADAFSEHAVNGSRRLAELRSAAQLACERHKRDLPTPTSVKAVPAARTEAVGEADA